MTRKWSWCYRGKKGADGTYFPRDARRKHAQLHKPSRQIPEKKKRNQEKSQQDYKQSAKLGSWKHTQKVDTKRVCDWKFFSASAGTYHRKQMSHNSTASNTAAASIALLIIARSLPEAVFRSSAKKTPPSEPSESTLVGEGGKFRISGRVTPALWRVRNWPMENVLRMTPDNVPYFLFHFLFIPELIFPLRNRKELSLTEKKTYGFTSGGKT